MSRSGSAAACRLACVFAHPDDESYGPAGTVARCSAQGVQAHLICATRGEAGTIGRSAEYPPEELARTREAELHAAAAVIGYRSVDLLGYPDRGVDTVPEERGAADVYDRLRALSPDVVVTFHPLGISGHPDHRAMTRFTTAAVRMLRSRGEANPMLHYYTVPASVAREITFRSMPLVPDEEVTIEIDTAEFVEVKKQAIHCHRTQLAFYHQLMSHVGGMARFEREYFTTEGVDGTRGTRGSELHVPGRTPGAGGER